MTHPRLSIKHFVSLVVITSMVLFIHQGIKAQELAQLPKAKFITKFPFTLTSRGIIVLKGFLGEKPDSLNFILDTGCGGISLDSSTAVDLNLTATGSQNTIKGLADIKPATYILNQQLRLPNLVVDNLDFHVNDYSFLSEAYGIKINGVIGYSFLKSYIVKLNYNEWMMEVWQPGVINYPAGGYVVRAGANKLSAIDATVRESRAVNGRFFFDTGADLCFLLSDKFINDSNLLGNNKKIIRSEGEGLGGKKEMRLTTINEVHIGPYTLKKVPAYIFNDSYNVSNYPANGGVIGNELMKRFNVVINYPGNEICLSPNARFKAPFNYAFVGCNISIENGNIIIKDLVKDSPAQIAGLNNDDVILGINNNFKNNIDEYKAILTQTGTKVKVSFLHNNQIRSTVLEVQSIL